MERPKSQENLFSDTIFSKKFSFLSGKTSFFNKTQSITGSLENVLPYKGVDLLMKFVKLDSIG